MRQRCNSRAILREFPEGSKKLADFSKPDGWTRRTRNPRAICILRIQLTIRGSNSCPHIRRSEKEFWRLTRHSTANFLISIHCHVRLIKLQRKTSANGCMNKVSIARVSRLKEARRNGITITSPSRRRNSFCLCGAGCVCRRANRFVVTARVAVWLRERC